MDFNLSAGREATSSSLGAQDAQHSGEGAQARLRCGQNRCPGNLSDRRPPPRPRLLSAPFAATGRANIQPWCGNWSAICPNCWPSSAFPGTCGESCALPTSSNAASLKCAAEPGPWSASSMCNPWTESSTPSSRDSTCWASEVQTDTPGRLARC